MSDEEVFRGSASHEVALNQVSGDAVGRVGHTHADESRRIVDHTEFAPPDDPPALQGVPLPPEGSDPYVPAQAIPPQPPEVIERLTPLDSVAGTDETPTSVDSLGIASIGAPDEPIHLSAATMARAAAIHEVTVEIGGHLDELDNRLGLTATA